MRAERGSTVPLVALLVVMAGGLCLLLGRLGGVANAAATAQTAADAAALAGAAEDEAAARSLARSNGGRVVAYDEDGDEVQVAVRVGTRSARARATTSGRSARPGGSIGGLAPELEAALDRAATLLGRPVPVTSGWRSYAEQQRLYDRRGSNRYPVARPGTSEHERGRAVDVPLAFADRLAAVAPRVGLCRPWPENDPVHFEVCRR